MSIPAHGDGRLSLWQRLPVSARAHGIGRRKALVSRDGSQGPWRAFPIHGCSLGPQECPHAVLTASPRWPEARGRAHSETHSGACRDDCLPLTLWYSLSARVVVCTLQFVAPPGYWTCSMCMFKFNPPIPVAGVRSHHARAASSAPSDSDGAPTFADVVTALTAIDGPVVDPKDTPCEQCGATFNDAGSLPTVAFK